jgi:hypothetical protein
MTLLFGKWLEDVLKNVGIRDFRYEIGDTGYEKNFNLASHISYLKSNLSKKKPLNYERHIL